MKNDILVTVIIPTYNRSTLLSRTIDSVINQTFQGWELLVVDDGSTDNTREVVEKYAEKDPRIRYFYQKNSGSPAKPRNQGIGLSKGSYIAFLDHDDEWLPEKLEKQLKLFEDSNILNLGFVACNVFVVSNGEKKLVELKERGSVFARLIEGDFIWSCSSVMVKRQVFDKVGLFDESLKCADDWDMWLRICKSGYGFDFSNEPLFNYYLHESNVLKSVGSLKIHFEQEYILKKYPQTSLNKKINYDLGVGFLQAGDAAKAKEYLSKSIKIKPRRYFTDIKAAGAVFLLLFGDIGLSCAQYLIKTYVRLK